MTGRAGLAISSGFTRGYWSLPHRLPCLEAGMRNGRLNLLQRETDLQSDLIAVNLAVLDVAAHLHDLEPAKIS
jgi:hypothetical protein